MLVRDIENWYYKAKPMPTAAQTSHWLSWLAKQLQQESKDEFLIEGLQPKNLKNRKQQKIYNGILGLSVGLSVGLGSGLSAGPILWLSVGLSSALSVGAFFGLTENLENWINPENRINPVETFEFSLTPVKIRKIFRGLIAGLTVGLIFVLIGGHTDALILPLTFGLIFGLIFGLKADFAARKYPNQGIFASLQNFIWIASFTFLILSIEVFFSIKFEVSNRIFYMYQLF
jgi:hypothetical protein